MEHIFSGQEASSHLNNGLAVFKQANVKPNKKMRCTGELILLFNLVLLHYFKSHLNVTASKKGVQFSSKDFLLSPSIKVNKRDEEKLRVFSELFSFFQFSLAEKQKTPVHYSFFLILPAFSLFFFWPAKPAGGKNFLAE